ncbi:hypothetical protein SAMN05192559_101206 [Halobacillus karajensis]|uniref:Zinc-ribbon domain-containing protein n=1 Tax=Halobacillus karajensis TaxID=195088 RepID=A0A024P3U1_9BACI|nr:zinc ribbon domain-containing protein [Halobacillus karajensis]CDQ19141.1 hypothetical protein BN982_01425 [Halobacillus karajensis]CDQ22785.1 hypothetical protein BN983_01001 [Halobacillus karajensis]CDQ26267.1 hypothetical protein BN981_00481 [Halobacillus karajensis]SEH40996.1 hypothetical protein SAMN05192559_101206 [Halobacillus karajensis]
MLVCSACGSKMHGEALFCGVCGAELDDQNNKDIAYKENILPQQQQRALRSPMAASPSIQPRKYAAKVAHTGKQFYSFAFEILKNPYHVSRNIDEKQKTNGIFSHLLLAFLLSFYFYSASKSISYGIVETPLFQLFIYLLTFLAVSAAFNFIIARLMRVNISYMSVVAKFGALNILPITGLILADLCILLSMNIFSTFFSFLSLCLLVISSMALLFLINEEREERGGLDLYYGVLILQVLVIVCYSIFLVTVVSDWMTRLRYDFFGIF